MKPENPPTEPPSNNPKLDLDIVNEVPDVDPDPPKQAADTDSSHIKHHKSKHGKGKENNKRKEHIRFYV